MKNLILNILCGCNFISAKVKMALLKALSPGPIILFSLTFTFAAILWVTFHVITIFQFNTQLMSGFFISDKSSHKYAHIDNKTTFFIHDSGILISQPAKPIVDDLKLNQLIENQKSELAWFIGTMLLLVPLLILVWIVALNHLHRRAAWSLAKFPAEDPDPVFRTTHKGIIIYCNNSAKNLLKDFDLLTPHSLPPILSESIKNAVNTQQPNFVELTTTNQCYLFTTVPIKNENYINIYGTDITLRKKAETKLTDAMHSAEKATRTKSLFLATMSHEIRTPLNAVIGMQELLAESKLTPVQSEYVQTARESGKALLTLINDILDFSKIEAGKVDLNYSEFDIVHIVESVIELLSPRAHSKNIEVGSVISKNVPQKITSDPGRVRQILFNLVGNAIKFTEVGGVKVYLSCINRNNSKFLQIKVCDTGIGISAKHTKHIFSEFTQVDSSLTRKYEGTGLGLAITKQLIELMGGTITVSSKLNSGSTFFFEIPLKSTSTYLAVNNVALSYLSTIKVIIIEPDRILRECLSEQLIDWGTKIDLYQDLNAAIDRGKENTEPVIIFIDQAAISTSDSELIHSIKVRQDLNNIKIILISSSKDINDKLTFECFIDGRLKKPIRIHHLLRCIGKSSTVATLSPISKTDFKTASIFDYTDKKARILLAEDSRINQLVATTLLKKYGYHVDAVNNGLEVLQSLDNFSYDMILMDVQMPEMDGFQATKTIRTLSSESATIPIIAMTANAYPEDRQRCLNAGMNDFLTKPINKDELLQVTAHWCTQSKGRNNGSDSSCN